jgi:predicted glycogen debranching enzyme
MKLPVRTVPLPKDLDRLLDREWIATNGLGGYASSSIAGVPTRRFHGLLVAALPAPIGRAMMLSELAETVTTLGGRTIHLAGYERNDRPTELDVAQALRAVRLEGGLPVWEFAFDGCVLEKRVLLVHGQNSVIASYRLVEGEHVRLDLRPFVSFRPHEGPVAGPTTDDYRIVSDGGHHEIHGPQPFPPLRMMITPRAPLALDAQEVSDVCYRIERARGYDWLGRTWSPGRFEVELTRDQPVSLTASTEAWDDILAPDEALAAETFRRERLLTSGQGPAELVLAADAFIIVPCSRRGDAVKARAAGDELRSVIAGYHWFTDWGRDTMIALEGLTLTTGRHREAGYILRTFARYVRDGLIPNMFPEGETAGLYHTADATLWFFHALDRYLAHTGDRQTLRALLPTLRAIADAHLHGTRFGIRVDPEDGLLTQGEEGVQLTWMDAKVDGWVVTPRRGKAVEINALFYNALCLLAQWLAEEGIADPRIGKAAERARVAFGNRFWNASEGYLFDVVDGPHGNDPALRPNQIFAVSLPHAVLDSSRWQAVVDIVERTLLTPVGLRSLAPSHADYKPTYDGDLRARDAAYHQGTVWSWLIGPFVDAWQRVHPGSDASHFLAGFVPHLDDACIGTVSEIFDAEAPFTPRGCAAQAWGVAEVLRVKAKLRTL